MQVVIPPFFLPWMIVIYLFFYQIIFFLTHLESVKKLFDINTLNFLNLCKRRYIFWKLDEYFTYKQFFFKQKMHSSVILTGIYSRIFTRIDSLFRAGAYTLCFRAFWLYLYEWLSR